MWRVLTDYDKLADFVPNLLACERTPCPNPGRIRLRQRGCSQSVFLRLEAQAVLELQEVHKPMNRRELHFVAVEGDFEVRYSARAHGSVRMAAASLTTRSSSCIWWCTCLEPVQIRHTQPASLEPDKLASLTSAAQVDKLSTALRCLVPWLCARPCRTVQSTGTI